MLTMTLLCYLPLLNCFFFFYWPIFFYDDDYLYGSIVGLIVESVYPIRVSCPIKQNDNG